MLSAFVCGSGSPVCGLFSGSLVVSFCSSFFTSSGLVTFSVIGCSIIGSLSGATILKGLFSKDLLFSGSSNSSLASGFLLLLLSSFVPLFIPISFFLEESSGVGELMQTLSPLALISREVTNCLLVSTI